MKYKAKKNILKFICVIIGLFIITTPTYSSYKSKDNLKCKNLELNDDDFFVNYKDNRFSVDSDFSNLIKKIGTGDAGKNNNYGFIGYSSENKYKYFQHNYSDNQHKNGYYNWESYNR